DASAEDLPFAYERPQGGHVAHDQHQVHVGAGVIVRPAWSLRRPLRVAAVLDPRKGEPPIVAMIAVEIRRRPIAVRIAEVGIHAEASAIDSLRAGGRCKPAEQNRRQHDAICNCRLTRPRPPPPPPPPPGLLSPPRQPPP